MRVATVERKTKETKIKGRVALDGTGTSEITTGIGFLDHMLDQLAKHSLIDIALQAKGDLHIDFHHTTEDTGYVIGAAVSKALGEIAQSGEGVLPKRIVYVSCNPATLARDAGLVRAHVRCADAGAGAWVARDRVRCRAAGGAGRGA